MTSEVKKMKKKEKRKKEKLLKAEDNLNNEDGNDNSKLDERKTSNSRSRSRGRRSLSSLFRRSGTRPESGDRSKLLSSDAIDDSTEMNRDINPRKDPRGHFKRMTVREALVYNRNRGRSPNRRTMKLEKTILDNEPGLADDSMSASLPHLLDHVSVDQSDEPVIHSTSVVARSGSTLPRMKKKKKRGLSEGRIAQRFRLSDSQDSNISIAQDKPKHILPLDKRKYFINQGAVTSADVTDNVCSFHNLDKHNNDKTNRLHSSETHEFQIPRERSESEKRRRESLNRFLLLRETKPAHSSLLTIPIEHSLSDSNDKDLPVVNISKSTLLSSKSCSTETFDQNCGYANGGNLANIPVSNIADPNATASPIMEYTLQNNTTHASIIPGDHTTATKCDKRGRSYYVSPRRFSRSPRTSVTSNKSNVSDTSNRTLSPEHKSHYDPELTQGKYHRRYSRESRKTKVHENETKYKTPDNQMIDASTSMSKLSSPNIGMATVEQPSHYIDISTDEISSPNTDMRDETSSPNTGILADEQSATNAYMTTYELNSQDPDITPKSVINVNKLESINCHVLSDTENNIKTVGSELVKPDEITKSEHNEDAKTGKDGAVEQYPEEVSSVKSDMSALQRDIVVISTDDVRKSIQTPDHESVFMPIKCDSDLSEEHVHDDVHMHKIQHVDFHADEIEVISSDVITENNVNDADPSVLETVESAKNKKMKVKIKEADKSDSKHEKDDKTFFKKSWSGKSKKEKRKSKKGKNRKGHGSSEKSVTETELEIQECQTTPSVSLEVESAVVKEHENINNKKRKSILKKHSKVKQNKLKLEETKLCRTSSLSNIQDENTSEILEKRQRISTNSKRSKSLADISHNDKNQRQSRRLQTSEGEGEKSVIVSDQGTDSKDEKRPPRLSIAAIVAIRAKVRRMKRAKQANSEMKSSKSENYSELKNDTESPTGDNIQDSAENADMSVARVYYENEINTTIGKSDSLSIIEDTDKEVKDLVYEKRIQFSPYCDDTVSEEEMIKQRQRNTRLTSRRESKVRQRQKKVINCCKKGIAFLFSHIGLCSLVVGYCILGGMIFKALEGENEIQQKKEIKALRQNFTEKIHRLAFETTLTKGNRDTFMLEVNAILKNFSVMIHKQTKEAGWDGKEVREIKFGEKEIEPEQWSYPSSLLYAITVMTTIGKHIHYIAIINHIPNDWHVAETNSTVPDV